LLLLITAEEPWTSINRLQLVFTAVILLRRGVRQGGLMPITYQIDHSHRLVNAYGHGSLRDEDFFHYQQEVWGRPDVVGYNEIVDMSNVSSIECESADQMRQLAELSARMDSLNIPSKFAIVVSNPLYYELGRLYEAYRGLKARSMKQVRVFKAREDALKWLETGEEGELLYKIDPGDG
jgi:hypothetical protein